MTALDPHIIICITVALPGQQLINEKYTTLAFHDIRGRIGIQLQLDTSGCNRKRCQLKQLFPYGQSRFGRLVGVPPLVDTTMQFLPCHHVALVVSCCCGYAVGYITSDCTAVSLIILLLTHYCY